MNFLFKATIYHATKNVKVNVTSSSFELELLSTALRWRSKVVCVMTPREQLRKMTALGEQGTLDEKHWYRLVNGMSAGGERSLVKNKYNQF